MCWTLALLHGARSLPLLATFPQCGRAGTGVLEETSQTVPCRLCAHEAQQQGAPALLKSLQFTFACAEGLGEAEGVVPKDHSQ